MKKFYVLLAVMFSLLSTYSFSQTYHNLAGGSLTINWNDISLITTDNVWTGYASVRGFRGDNLTGVTGADPQTLLGADDPGVVNVEANELNPNTFSTGGVIEFHITDPVVALNGSGTADAPYLKFYLNTTNRSDITVSYTLRDIDGSVDNAIQPYALHYRIGNSGAWTNVPGGFVADATTGPSLATQTTTVSLTLPAAVNNQSMIEVRIITANAVGNDESVGIDDIVFASSPLGVNATVASTTNMTEAGTNGVFTLTFSGPVPAGGTTISYSLSGTATPGIGNDYTDPNAGSIFVAAGETSAAITLNVIDDAIAEPTESITITLTGGTNSVSITATPATITLTDNETTQIAGYDFNTCTATLSDGFTQFSVTGAQVWGCTTFGRNSTNGVQMNGFASGNQTNTDWLISPSIDLSATNFPLLNFWSRTTFAGQQLRLYVSTDYVSGDPTTATWTEIDGRFPLQFSDTWTLSSNINLDAFKTSNVHFAFVYNSTTEAASRITLDDIYLLNASAAPAPTLTTNSTLLDFRYVAFGGSSSNKSFTFWANDLTTDVTITAPANFEVSEDGIAFSSSIDFTPAETKNQLKTVYVRYTPSSANQTSGDYLTFTTTGFTHERVFVKGNSYPPASTLNIVNWNIEWFGATGQGPTNEDLQQANAETVMDIIESNA